jgi:hypothetical protein
MNMTVDAAMAASMTDSRCWPDGTLGGILHEGREQPPAARVGVNTPCGY